MASKGYDERGRQKSDGKGGEGGKEERSESDGARRTFFSTYLGSLLGRQAIAAAADRDRDRHNRAAQQGGNPLLDRGSSV